MNLSALRDRRPDETATFAVPVEPEAVGLARAAARDAARAAGLSPDRADDLVIAVSEATTNAVEAQLVSGVTAPIELGCRVVGAQLEVSVRDHGTGFAPDELPSRPPLHDPRHLDVERGWGIQLMRKLVDEVMFDVSSDGTIVCLRMKLA